MCFPTSVTSKTEYFIAFSILQSFYTNRQKHYEHIQPFCSLANISQSPTCRSDKRSKMIIVIIPFPHGLFGLILKEI